MRKCTYCTLNNFRRMIFMKSRFAYRSVHANRVEPTGLSINGPNNEVWAAMSSTYFLKNGTPRGNVLISLVFLIMINDLTGIVKRRHACIVRGQRGLMWKSGPNLSALSRDVQRYLTERGKFFEEWWFKISVNKTDAIIFTRSKPIPADDVILKITDFMIKLEKTVKCLQVQCGQPAPSLRRRRLQSIDAVKMRSDREQPTSCIMKAKLLHHNPKFSTLSTLPTYLKYRSKQHRGSSVDPAAAGCDVCAGTSEADLLSDSRSDDVTLPDSLKRWRVWRVLPSSSTRCWLQSQVTCIASILGERTQPSHACV